MSEKRIKRSSVFTKEDDGFTGQRSEVRGKRGEKKQRRQRAEGYVDKGYVDELSTGNGSVDKKGISGDGQGAVIGEWIGEPGREAGRGAGRDFMAGDGTFAEERLPEFHAGGQRNGRRNGWQNGRRNEWQDGRRNERQNRRVNGRQNGRSRKGRSGWQGDGLWIRRQEAGPGDGRPVGTDGRWAVSDGSGLISAAARKSRQKKAEFAYQRTGYAKPGLPRHVIRQIEPERLFRSEEDDDNAGADAAGNAGMVTEDAYHFVKREMRAAAGYGTGTDGRADAGGDIFADGMADAGRGDFGDRPMGREGGLKEHRYSARRQKDIQKRRIKREYAKGFRVKSIGGTSDSLSEATDRIKRFFRNIRENTGAKGSVKGFIAIIALLFVFIIAMASSCSAALPTGMGGLLAGCYMSSPSEIDAADLALSELEMELQERINAIETDYPDYDEYNYNLDPIGHDPFALISYLSAKYTEFTAAGVQTDIEGLFDAMYELTLTETTETRTRPVTDPVTGEETGEEEEYEASILNVRLQATDLRGLALGRLDTEQEKMFVLYNQTHGLTQVYYPPLDLYWYNYVGSYYGYRIDPATGIRQLHRGLDIAVPSGTDVYASMDGTVAEAGYDSHYGYYVVVANDKGYQTKYAHLDSLSVSTGQEVVHGDPIGMTGSTGSSIGSHLHIECMYMGEYYNPLFYFAAGEETLYGEDPAPGSSGSGGGIVAPPGEYGDDAVRALLEEAAKYLGYPYVWGGSNPSTGFDCSGFVCWVFSNSGVYDLPRTSAQGIYDQCSAVPASAARPGDIIFFTGTYSSGNPVTHVGIYCGNGVMIHAGDPIKYSNINTSYWQSHFYGFGRL